MRFRDTVTVVRAAAGASPDGGDPIPNWTAATTTDYLGELQPLTTTEVVVAAQQTDSTHKAFLPPGTDVKATDRLRHQGLDYEIDGLPLILRSRGRAHHIEVPCFRRTGG